jgi:Cu-Zn family superoxide dismutase
MGKGKRFAAAAAAMVTSVGALALHAETSGATNVVARAALQDQAGQSVGEVVFKKRGQEIIGEVEVVLPVADTEFRGFHIHANNDTSNGDGCVASGAFVSADGHWNRGGGGTHGSHTGDLPVLMRDADGHARAEFAVGKLEPGEIVGRAVVVHSVADNYANIPSRYQSSTAGAPAGPDATTLANGDAGSRYACGVIVSDAEG